VIAHHFFILADLFAHFSSLSSEKNFAN